MLFFTSAAELAKRFFLGELDVMASNKRAGNGTASQNPKKPKNDGESQGDPSAFEMELAMFEEEMDIDFSQQSEGRLRPQSLLVKADG